MAIKHGEDQGQQPGQHEPAPSVSAGARTEHARPQQRPQATGLGGALNSIRRPMGRRVGEVLNGFVQTARELITHAGAQRADNWDVLPLDSGRFGLHYSAAVMVGVFDIGAKKVAATCTMILEASNTQPRSEPLTIYGQNIEVVRTAMDAWDEDTFNDVLELVTEHVGSGVEIINAGAFVVPSDLDMKDTDRMFDVLRVAQNAVSSVVEADHPDQFEYVNLAESFNRQVERMTASFIYNGPDMHNAVGLPVRSDIAIRLSLSDRTQQQQRDIVSSFQHQGSQDILEVSSYVDLVYVPPQPPAPGQMPLPQHYVAREVITDITALDAPNTPEVFLLGLATTRLIGENYAWAAQFSSYLKETAGRGKDGIHDIGAVGYRMTNPTDPKAAPQRFDTKSTSFGEPELFDLIQQTCHKDPAFSIDCEDVGPNAWLTSMFVMAAEGDRQANQYLIDAANRLTGGRFANYWAGDSTVAYSESNRVHLGTYVDDQGVMRDLREIDYLAMLNLFGHNNMDAVLEWEATYNDSNSPIELRLDRRLQLLREAVRGGMRVRGFATRVTISPQFMEALVNAVADAGLAVDQDGLRTMYGGNVQVGNQFISNYAVHGGNVSNLLNPTGPTGQFTGLRRPMGRWF